MTNFLPLLAGGLWVTDFPKLGLSFFHLYNNGVGQLETKEGMEKRITHSEAAAPASEG